MRNPKQEFDLMSPPISKETTMKTTFKKTIVIKSHQQTMDEFAAICDATIKGEKVDPEEAQYSFTSFEAARASGIPQEVVEAHILGDVPMIRAWREHIGITQAELATRMGWPNSKGPMQNHVTRP